MKKRLCTSRHRFAFVAYLGAVYTFYELLRRERIAKTSAHRIAKIFGIRTQKRTHSIRIIIDATSATDPKMRSRWSRALRYAGHERERWDDIQEFWQENHGPAGAAARWSALHQRKRECQVGLAMDDRVPEIPLIVDAPLLEPGQLFAKGGKVFRRPDVAEGNLQVSRKTEPTRDS
jgi:hypothetical protein